MGYKCHYCEKDPFESKNILTDHLALKHNRKFPCFLCNKGFEDKQFLMQHVSLCHNGSQKVFLCAKCKEVFLDALNHENHMKCCPPEKSYKCKYCVSDEKTFQIKTLFKYHLKKEHGRDFLCRKCDESFVDQKSLGEHLSAFCNNQKIDSSIQKKKVAKRESKEIPNESSFCKNINIEDQTFENEKSRQSYEAIQKELEQSLSRNDHLESENASLKSRNQSLALRLSSVEEELMKMKQNHT